MKLALILSCMIVMTSSFAFAQDAAPVSAAEKAASLLGLQANVTYKLNLLHGSLCPFQHSLIIRHDEIQFNNEKLRLTSGKNASINSMREFIVNDCDTPAKGNHSAVLKKNHLKLTLEATSKCPASRFTEVVNIKMKNGVLFVSDDLVNQDGPQHAECQLEVAQ